MVPQIRRRLSRAATIMICLLACVTARAGVRADHWSGFDIGAGTTPFPSAFGTMIGFNVNDDARLSLGYGSLLHWDTFQLDAKVFLGQAEWAMFIGTGLDYLNGSQGKFLFWTIPFDKGFIPYLETGVDFQSSVGVHLAFSLGLAVPGGTLIVWPGLAMGWYF